MDVGHLDAEAKRMMEGERARAKHTELRAREEHKMNMDLLEDLRRLQGEKEKADAIIKELRATVGEEERKWSR